MKYTLFIFLLLCFKLDAQQVLQWQKCLGGSESEIITDIQQTSDAGYIICGHVAAIGGDIQGPLIGGIDYWVIKLDSAGVIQWQQILGGTANDIPYAIRQTADGGYIVAGSTESNDVDVSGHHGKTDYWLVKLSKSGWLEWQKAYGGSASEECYTVRQTMDGGYILAGKSASQDGDASGNHGYFDYWIIKTNTLGNMEWEKSYGGSNGADKAYSIELTNDGGYIIAGTTNSKNGDVTGNHGDYDIWIVKIDSTGNIQWQKALGGVGSDEAQWVQQTSDGGYITVGYEGSGNTGNTGNVSGTHGLTDVWVVKLDSQGQLLWQKALGGSDTDGGFRIFENQDGNFFIAGLTTSSNGDVQEPLGSVDFWFLTLSQTGTLLSQKTLGGSDFDQIESATLTMDGGIVLVGFTLSNDGFVNGQHGGADGWIIKLSPQSTKTHLPQPTQLTLYPNPTTHSITLQLPDNEPITSIQITDLSGKTQKSLDQPGHNTLPVADLPKGMYLVKAASASGTVFCGKFIRE